MLKGTGNPHLDLISQVPFELPQSRGVNEKNHWVFQAENFSKENQRPLTWISGQAASQSKAQAPLPIIDSRLCSQGESSHQGPRLPQACAESMVLRTVKALLPF